MTDPPPSFFGGSTHERNPLPRCPVCSFVRMLPHEQAMGMCERCAGEDGVELDPLEKLWLQPHPLPNHK